MKDYEINQDTLALIPHNAKKTRVYETGKSFIVDQPILEIMEESCTYFGSTLKGRQQGTKILTGISHKAPVIIEESKEIIFFPTTSPRLPMCSWISLNNIESYKKKNNKMLITFRNDVVLDVNTSYGILDNQILRATRLESVLRKRKNFKNN